MAPRLPRLLLVEARRPPGLGDSNAEPFPFVAGYAESQGVPTRWICFPHEAWAAAPGSFLLDLDERARRQLLDHLAAVEASHLLLSEVPAPGLETFLAASAPGLRVRHCAAPRSYYTSDWLVAWLGLTEERPGYLPDLAAPSYRCVAAGDPVPVAPTPVIGEAPCLYAAPLASNPAYAGVDLRGVDRPSACTFCPTPPEQGHHYRLPPLELALRQIAAVRAEPETLLSRTDFVLRPAALFFQMSKLLVSLERAGAAPAALYFGCRADEILDRAGDVQAALEVARRRGHTIHVFSMGAESFSSAENERFNKRLSLATVRAALEQLRRWERDYPETFFFTRHGGLGFILFTPWTSLADLRLNLEAARELGLREDGFFLTRRLMLLGDTAIARLAERDGLVDPRDPEAVALFAWLQRHCDPGCRHFLGQQDRPWRFRDPTAARVCAVTVRLAKRDAVVDDDPYHRRLVEGLAASGVRLLDAFAQLLSLAAAAPEASLAELVERLVAALRAAAPAGRGPA
jgi:hypothetical protein